VIFDEDAEFLKRMDGGDGQQRLSDTDPHGGKVCYALTGRRENGGYLGPQQIRIREHPGPGEYRFIRWAWKKSDGKAIVLKLARDGGWRHYQAGASIHGEAAAVVDAALPTKWTVVTRDLFKEHGEFTLT